MEYFVNLLWYILWFCWGYILGKLILAFLFRERPLEIEESVGEKVSRRIFIEKIEDGKYLVYDKNTGTYICRFTNWAKLADHLKDVDPTIDWIIEYSYPEIDREKIG